MIPIDDVWATSNLEINFFKILPFSESVGDHRNMIFDVTSRSLLGKFEHRIIKKACRRLNTKPLILSWYNTTLLEQMKIHNMDQRLNALEKEISNFKPTPDQERAMNNLDRKFMELQAHAERKCSNIIKPELQFIGTVKMWHERIQSYKALIRWKTGLTDNDSNTIRTALRRGIEDPRKMTFGKMKEGEEHAIAQKRTYRCTHSEVIKDYLHQCLLKEEHGTNTEKCCGIRQKWCGKEIR